MMSPRSRQVWLTGASLALGALPSIVAPPALQAQTPAPRAQAPIPVTSPSLWQELFGPPPAPQSAAAPRGPTPPASRPLAAASNVAWEPLGRSVENRVIEFSQFGAGARHVLVVGSLMGDQPEGTALAEYLAAHLQRFPKRIGDVVVTIVRDPNPDGRARRQGTNARGVELDRNFPTAGWTSAGRGSPTLSGASAGSEPETRALVELLKDLQPDRVVLLGPSTARADVRFTGQAESIARLLATEAGVPLVGHDPRQLPGSLESYTGDDLGIPTIRFGFTPRATAEELWSSHKGALLTAVGCGSNTEFPEVPLRFGPRKGPQSLSPNGAAAAGTPTPEGSSEVTTSTTKLGTFRSVSSSAPGNDEPLPLKFEDLRQGLPLVDVQAPGSAAPPPASGKLERLPPVDSAQTPRPPSSSPPPKAYPSTGL